MSPRGYREVLVWDRKGYHGPFSLIVPGTRTKATEATGPIPRQAARYTEPTQRGHSQEDIQVDHYIRED